MKTVLDKDVSGIIIEVGDEYLVVIDYNKSTQIMTAKLCTSKKEAMDFVNITEKDISAGDQTKKGMH